MIAPPVPAGRCLGSCRNPAALLPGFIQPARSSYSRTLGDCLMLTEMAPLDIGQPILDELAYHLKLPSSPDAETMAEVSAAFRAAIAPCAFSPSVP